MIIQLCIANALSLWMSSNRDQIVAESIKKHTTEVETLMVYIVKPYGVPISCQKARDFVDEWFVPALDKEGVRAKEIIHSACSPTACACEGSENVCSQVMARLLL